MGTAWLIALLALIYLGCVIVWYFWIHRHDWDV